VGTKSHGNVTHQAAFAAVADQKHKDKLIAQIPADRCL
jgi:hypothetical protein